MSDVQIEQHNILSVLGLGLTVAQVNSLLSFAVLATALAVNITKLRNKKKQNDGNS